MLNTMRNKTDKTQPDDNSLDSGTVQETAIEDPETQLTVQSPVPIIFPAKPEELSQEQLLETNLFTYLDSMTRPSSQTLKEFISELNLIAEECEIRGIMAANLHRIRICIELLPSRPKKMSTEHSRMEWEKEVASKHHLSPRRFRVHMAAADAVQKYRTDPKMADSPPLPMAILKNRIDKIPAAIKNFIETGNAIATVTGRKLPSSKSAKNKSAANKYSFLEEKDETRAFRLFIDHLFKSKIVPEKRRLFLERILVIAKRELALYPAKSSNEKADVPRWLFLPAHPYAGGKYPFTRQLMDSIGNIDGYFADIQKKPALFVEPFIGTGAVSLNMLGAERAGRIWINDKDIAIAAVWNSIIHKPEELKSLVNMCEVTKSRWLEFNKILNDETTKRYPRDEVELALIKIVSHQCSYNGIGNKMKGPIKSIENKWNKDLVCKRIDQAHYLTKNRVEFDHCTNFDFKEVLSKAEERGNCFLFLDPPYIEQGEIFYNYPFVDKDHRELMHLLFTTDLPWLATYGEHSEIRKLAKNMVVIEKPALTGKSKKPELWICSKKHRYILEEERDSFSILELF